MNKLFTKIAALFLGMTMAVGVGVAVGTGSKASEVRADAVSLTYGNIWSGSGPWSTTSGTSSITFSANGGEHVGSGTSKANGTYYAMEKDAVLTSSGSFNIDETKDFSITCEVGYYGDKSGLTVSATFSWNGGSKKVTSSGITTNKINNFKTLTLDANTAGDSDVSVVISTNATGESATAKHVRFWSMSLAYTSGSTPVSTHKVSYNKNAEGASGTMSDKYADSSGNVTLDACTFEYPGYKFDGWATSSDGSVEYADGASITGLTADLPLYAKWSPATLTGISVKTAPTKVSYGIGETFDPAGLVIYLNYSDGAASSTATYGVDSGFSFNPDTSTPLQVTDTSVEITFSGKTCSQAITVSNLKKITLDPTATSSFPYQGITLTVTDGALDNGSDYRVYKNQTLTITSTVGKIQKIELTYSSASYDGGGWASSYQPDSTSWTSPTADGEQARITMLYVYVPMPDIAATINGNDSVDMNVQWSPTSVTEDASGNPVTGVQFSFTASGGAVISSSSETTGSFTSSSAGTVVVSATKTGYAIASKTVTVNSTLPYITPSKEQTSGFVTQHETLSFTYGHLSTLSVSSNNTSVVTVDEPSYSGGSGTVQINFVGNGSTTVDFKNGASVMASVSVSVATSSVVISGLPATGSVKINSTLDLASKITVTATGIYSDSVTWSTDKSSVATVVNGIVTGVAEGTANITVTSVDYPSATMTCAVTVSTAPTVDGTYVKLDDVSKLVNDATLIITSADGQKAMSTVQNANNRGTTTGASSADGEITIPKNSTPTIQVFTIETYDSGNKKIVAFKTLNGEAQGYIYAASSSANQLKTGSEVSNDSKFTVSINDGVFTVDAESSSNRSVLQYNSSSNLFACYGSASQAGVAIYIKQATDPTKVSSVAVNPTSLTLGVNGSAQLEATVYPETAVDPVISWSTSDGEVATVADGLVTGVAIGEATITVTATTGDVSKSATCTVSVLQMTYGFFYKITNLSELNNGDKIVFAAPESANPNIGLNTLNSSSKIDTTSTSSNNHWNDSFSDVSVESIRIDQVTTAWSVSKDGDYYKFSDADSNYLSYKSGTNLEMSNVASAANNWSIEAGLKGGAYKILNGSSTDRALCYQEDLSRIGPYAASNLDEDKTGYLTLDIYKLVVISDSDILTGLTCTGEGSYTADWTALETAFDQKSIGVKAYYKHASYDKVGSGTETVVTATNNTNEQIAKFIAKYDDVVSKYEVTDFIHRNPTQQNSGKFVISPLFNGENSNMVAIVVIVSVVSLTAIGGYFFLKKRREQN